MSSRGASPFAASPSATTAAQQQCYTDPENEALSKEWPAGFEVEAHGLKMQELNGSVGNSVGRYEDGRVGVQFPEPWGLKSLKPTNLKPFDGVFTNPVTLQKETCDSWFMQPYLQDDFDARQ